MGKRRFIRHPTSIPIDYTVLGALPSRKRSVMKDVSHGGLCFLSDHGVDPGEPIEVAILADSRAFEIKGEVTWCRRLEKHFEIGVRFRNEADEFAVRMVEQVCRIEAYRGEQAAKGRALSGNEAAREWIQRYAPQFNHAA